MTVPTPRQPSPGAPESPAHMVAATLLKLGATAREVRSIAATFPSLTDIATEAEAIEAADTEADQ